MHFATLIQFFFGRRQAIIDIASCRGSLFLGALFVLSAGFAREYDHEDLLHKPWLLLLPLAASLATSFLLFSILNMAAQVHTTTPLKFFLSYRRFLSLYWMTAPLAWIYAVPVEHFMSAGDAVRANLWFLGIVSAWRVLLITRCSSVYFGSSFAAAFFLVMFFADTFALFILYLTPLPIFNIMGGILLTESESVIRDAACMVQFYGMVSWPIWLIGACVVLGLANWQRVPNQYAVNNSTGISVPLWTLSILALLLWVFVLPYSQPPQRLRRTIESDLQNGRIELAIRQMSAHERQSFPPHWDPPPWPGYGQDSPPLIQVLQAVTQKPNADWVKNLYLDKLTRKIEHGPSSYYFWRSMDDNEFDDYMTILQNTPEMRDVVRRNSATLKRSVEHASDENSTRKDRLRSLMTVLDIDVPEADNRDHSDLPSAVNHSGESDHVQNGNVDQ